MRVDKIYMEITTSCNMQCLYCYNDSGKKNYYMSFLELKKIMDAFLTNGISSVGISGGEPLLHPEFEKIMEYLVNKDCSKVVVTNGLLAPQKLTKFLLSPEAKTDIQLSLDGGSASVNDQIRGVGHYQLVVDYMKLLAEQGYKTGLARMTISRINQKEVESFIDLCLQYFMMLKDLFLQYSPYCSLTEYSIEKNSNDEFIYLIKSKNDGYRVSYLSSDVYELATKIAAMICVRRIVDRQLYCYDDYISFHCAGLSKARHLFVFLGPTGSGKTTLATFLAKQEYTYLTDDRLIMPANHPFGDVTPFFRSPHLRDAAWRLLQERYHLKCNAHKKTIYGQIRWTIDFAETLKPFYHEKIVFLILDRKESSCFSMCKISGKEAFQALLMNIMYPGDIMSTIKALPSLLEKSTVYKLQYNDLFQVRDGLNDFLDVV